MSSGKSIQLFLIDGTPDGVIACELFNWTGKGYRIPRNNLKDVSGVEKKGVVAGTTRKTTRSIERPF
ncbi:MAG: hypothetical protein JW913_19280 [Chitinispirillaceae bacterium]|nr:hypothetical protein [Chitinispirillaceae bacterium]